MPSEWPQYDDAISGMPMLFLTSGLRESSTGTGEAAVERDLLRLATRDGTVHATLKDSRRLIASFRISSFVFRIWSAGWFAGSSSGR
jgi:hypothetical protein